MHDATDSPLRALTTGPSAQPDTADTTGSDAPDHSVAAASGDQPPRRATARRSAQDELLAAQLIEDQCRKLNRSIFFRGAANTRVLGLTSAVAGEGRTFLAAVCASVLARESGLPVVLLECDWEHPSHHAVFDLPARRGLAEWLRGEAHLTDIRYQVRPHLTVIPAGEGADDAIQLIRRLRQPNTWQQLLGREALVIVDLPPVLTCAYGRLAAELTDAVVVVVRAGVTHENQVAQACSELAGSDIRGIVLNQVHSHVPGWLRSIL